MTAKPMKTLELHYPMIRQFLISSGNRTEWSPIRSVIIRVMTNSFVTSIIITKSYYQLVIKIKLQFREKKNNQVMK